LALAVDMVAVELISFFLVVRSESSEADDTQVHLLALAAVKESAGMAVLEACYSYSVYLVDI
jgi:hypothetical protein